jgi:hypothetical protein
MEKKEETRKKNKRLALWLGFLAITIGVLSYRFWQQFIAEVISIQA